MLPRKSKRMHQLHAGGAPLRDGTGGHRDKAMLNSMLYEKTHRIILETLMKTAAAAACVLVGSLLGSLVYLGGTLNAQALSERRSVDAAACARLMSLSLPNTTVTSAQVVPAGQFKPPAGADSGFAGLPAFCRVALTIAPSHDSDIKSETWLPLSGWNGKFEEVGNGGWSGDIQYGALAEALRRGYAAASTDTGHAGGSASFALGHPEKVIDFGYRAVHETALQSKAMVAALYGNAPRLSYFAGCSGGGRQAFAEAQRFPDDFEGIIAGDPGYDRTAESFQLVSLTQAAMEGSRRQDSAGKISHDPPGRSGRVRCARWPQGRHYQRSHALQIRSRGDAVQRRG